MKNDFESGPLDTKPEMPKREFSVLGNTPARKSLHGRRSSTRKVQLRELNNGKVIYISLLFAMVFSPFNGIQNFLFEIMHEYGYNYLGLMALGIFYISFGYGSLYTPQYSTRVDYKFTFLLSFFPMGLLFLSLEHSMACVNNSEDSGLCSSTLIHLIVLICSALAGLGTSLLWISKTIYVTDSSNPYNKGKMFGTFTSIAQWTQMIGIAFTGLILYDFKARTLFYLAMIVCFAASALALGIKSPEKHSGDAHMMYELGNFNQGAMTVEGTERLLQKSDIVIPRMEYFTKQFFVRCLSAPKMTIFYPLFIASACNFSVFVTYLAGDVLSVLKEDVETAFSEVALKVTGVFLALGLGEVLAHKFFSAKINTNKGAALSTLYKTFLLSAILHLILGKVKMYSLYIPLAFLYGVGDNGSQEVIGGLISMKFVERFEPFTCFRIVYFTALGIFLLLNIVLVGSAPVVSFILFIMLTVGAWLNNYKFFTSLS